MAAWQQREERLNSVPRRGYAKAGGPRHPRPVAKGWGYIFLFSRHSALPQGRRARLHVSLVVVLVPLLLPLLLLLLLLVLVLSFKLVPNGAE